MGLNNTSTCNRCGGRVYFLATGDDVGNLGKAGWTILNADDRQLHKCPAGPKVKVFTPEERAEFARRRQAGEL